jgi:cysteine desulfurase / selenocysteine lyase
VLATDSRRFESGTENSAGIAGPGATVNLVHELGRCWVEECVLDRAEELAALLEEADKTVHLPEHRERRSGIVIAGSATVPPEFSTSACWQSPSAVHGAARPPLRPSLLHHQR